MLLWGGRGGACLSQRCPLLCFPPVSPVGGAQGPWSEELCVVVGAPFARRRMEQVS